MKSICLSLIFVLSSSACLHLQATTVICWQENDENEKALITASQKEDLEGVKAALKAGADVNAKTDYGSTALFFASDRGNLEIAKVLIEAGADPNVKDSFYSATPVTWATQGGHKEIVALLIANGGDGGGGILLRAIQKSDVDFAMQILNGKPELDEKDLIRARDAAQKKSKVDGKFNDLIERLNSYDLPAPVKIEMPPAEVMEKYAGKYKASNLVVEVKWDGEDLMINFNGSGDSILEFVKENEFGIGSNTIQFEMNDGEATKMLATFGANKMELTREGAKMAEEKPDVESKKAETKKEPEFAKSSAESLAADKAIASANWASFRGNGARGVAEGQSPPTEWSVHPKDESKNKNLNWKTAIPGLGLSCPSIWETKSI